MSQSFVEAIYEIYRQHPHHYWPHIGARFLDPDPAHLRVLVLGINPYVDDEQWPSEGPDPSWYASWYQNAAWRYQQRVRRAVQALVGGLADPERIFQGRIFHGPDSTYATNAIKVWMRASEGKRADQLRPEHFEQHREQWHQELRLMAQHGALPHLLIVFGEPPWETAWRAFYPFPTGTKSGLAVASYRNPTGAAHHHANLIGIELGGSRLHELLLVRLRHPAGRSPTGAPSWLLQQPDFCALTAQTSGRAL